MKNSIQTWYHWYSHGYIHGQIEKKILWLPNDGQLETSLVFNISIYASINLYFEKVFFAKCGEFYCIAKEYGAEGYRILIQTYDGNGLSNTTLIGLGALKIFFLPWRQGTFCRTNKVWWRNIGDFSQSRKLSSVNRTRKKIARRCINSSGPLKMIQKQEWTESERLWTTFVLCKLLLQCQKINRIITEDEKWIH